MLTDRGLTAWCMKYLLLPFLFLLALAAHAQTAVSKFAPGLSEVIVYLNGAELQHSGELNLSAGQTEVRITNISAYIEPKSLQVEVGSNAELLSANLIKVPGAMKVNDSLSLLEKELRNASADLAALREEQNFLAANRKLPDGMQAGWSSELQKGADFIRNRFKENLLRIPELEAKINRLSGNVAALQQSGGRRLVAGQVQELVLRLRVSKAGVLPVKVRYLTYGSQWEPRLSFRVPEVTKEMKLQALSEAQIYNNSDLNWDNVKLSLKTANPQVSATRPDLQPWTLQFSGGSFDEGRLDEFAVKGSSAGRSRDSSEVAIAELSTVFQIPGRVSIRRGSDFQTRLNEQMLPMRLEYLTIPKLDQDVFLVAKVTEWEKLNIVSEKATVYYRGAYLGETEISTRAYNDTLEVSLGRDYQVVVSRTKREDFNSKNFIGNVSKSKLAYEINIRNNHAAPVKLRVLDQIPVSQEKEIEVKDVEVSGAQLEPRSGKLTWQFTLMPGESRKLPFSFSIEYPKNKRVNLHRSRKVTSPKFR